MAFFAEQRDQRNAIQAGPKGLQARYIGLLTELPVGTNVFLYRQKLVQTFLAKSANANTRNEKLIQDCSVGARDRYVSSS